MKYLITTSVLWPLLIPQALYVRWVTPRLPEPPGERSGTDGSGVALRLLILGDSAAAGVGVSSQDKALSGQLVSALVGDFLVRWKLVAKSGLKAKDVLAELEMLDPEPFDVVVTSIGVNDVTHRTGIRNWLNQLRRIVELLGSVFRCRHIILSAVPPMHLFSALPQPLRWYLGARAGQFNGALKKFAGSCDRCDFVAAEFPLETAYLAADGFHPGAPAYALWARHIAAIIRNRFNKL